MNVLIRAIVAITMTIVASGSLYAEPPSDTVIIIRPATFNSFQLDDEDPFQDDEPSSPSDSTPEMPEPDKAPMGTFCPPAVSRDTVAVPDDSFESWYSPGFSNWFNCQDMGEPWTLQSEMDRYEDPRFNYGGWMSLGYHSDNVQRSVINGDLGSFNDVPGRFNAHQMWLQAGREAQGVGQWDWGFGVDFVYGTDAQKTQAFGGAGWDVPWDNGVYGWALPQVYLTLNRDEWTIQLGHFFTLVGYETVAAPNNFFYSHALTMVNSEPFTHTGALATYAVDDDTAIYAGWTLGWDTGFEGFNGSTNFLGGFTTSLFDNVSLTYILTAGNMGMRGRGYAHSLVLDMQLTENLNWVVQNDMVNLGVAGVNNGQNNDQVGINQYLLYTVSDCVRAGIRLEWWKTDGASQYEVTGGVNIQPHANLVIRPELRYDWGSPITNPNAVFGVDGIVTF